MFALIIPPGSISANAHESITGRSPIQKPLPSQEMSKKLMSPSRPKLRSLKRGEWLSDQQIWQVQSGFLRTVSWDEDGNVIVLGIWGIGDLVSRQFSRLNPCQVECISEAILESVQTFDPEHLLEQRHQVEELLNIIHSRQMSKRLLMVLQWLARRFGVVTESGCLIDMRLTHQQLSDIAGTTRVTVTRLLNQLEQQGQISRRRSHRIMLHQDLQLQNVHLQDVRLRSSIPFTVRRES
jgi:CRP-like cAMP-binding protein